jgi:alpha-ketoglutarate-dependent taurine dioxygenase
LAPYYGGLRPDQSAGGVPGGSDSRLVRELRVAPVEVRSCPVRPSGETRIAVPTRRPGCLRSSIRKALYVNGGHTLRFVGMTEAESAPLLEYLFAHRVRPEFTCRFHWEPG